MNILGTSNVIRDPSGRSLAGIVSSNPAGWDGCLSIVLCVVRWKFLRRAGHSSTGVLPSVVCFECNPEASIMRRLWPTRDCCAVGKNVMRY